MTVRRNENDDIEIVLPGDMNIDDIREFLTSSLKSYEIMSKLTEEEKNERFERAFEEIKRKRKEQENTNYIKQ